MFCGQKFNQLEGQYKQLAELFLPIGILDYFDLVNTSKVGKEIKIYLEEKNTVPEEYKGQQLHSKCFLPEIAVQDFPIRGQKVALCIKRRRWEVVSSEEIVSRNWTLVREGTRMTTEFGLFLKGIFG